METSYYVIIFFGGNRTIGLRNQGVHVDGGDNKSEMKK